MKLDLLLQQRVHKLDYLLHNFKSDVLKIWLPIAACGASLLGLSAEASLEKYRDSSAPVTVSVPSSNVPSGLELQNEPFRENDAHKHPSHR